MHNYLRKIAIVLIIQIITQIYELPISFILTTFVMLYVNNQNTFVFI